MISNNRLAKFATIGIAALLCSACLDQMEPAKQALDEISHVLTTASADAAKYAPDQMASVQKELADLKITYDRKGYGDVLAHAPGVLADAKSLAADAAAKREEIGKALNTKWTGFSSSVPREIAAARARVDALSRAQRLPKGVDLAAARSGLTDANAGWAQAQTAYSDGQVDEAIAIATGVQSKIAAAAAALKLELPGN